MENYEALLATLALMMGSAWASGINLYAVLLVLGLGGSTGHIDLPSELTVLQDPLVFWSAGIMYFVGFFVDKIPGVDTGWDAIHTFIRIPAGAMLAAGAVGDVTPALEIAAGILGGGLSATSHATKSGTRLLINTSPEPFTNWTASVTEDFLVIGGLWTALNYPIIFLILLFIFICSSIWVLPRLWRLIKIILTRIGKFFGLIKAESADIVTSTIADIKTRDSLAMLEQLQKLRDMGVLTEQEFQTQKNKILQKDNTM
ncbi:MAG: DUF4126 family protein [Pseudomonadota bacterium]